jgi:hypothetical protein
MKVRGGARLTMQTPAVVLEGFVTQALAYL